MPVEFIGEVGTPGAEREWIAAQAALAIKHLEKTCGEPPPEMELELRWQEHELGSYPLIVLTWEDAMRGAPRNYIARCEAALAAYENGGELPPSWSMPPVRDDDDESDGAPFDPDQPPPDPPEGSNIVELQRYMSKLAEWSIESIKREREESRSGECDEREDESTEDDEV